MLNVEIVFNNIMQAREMVRTIQNSDEGLDKKEWSKLNNGVLRLKKQIQY